MHHNVIQTAFVRTENVWKFERNWPLRASRAVTWACVLCIATLHYRFQMLSVTVSLTGQTISSIAKKGVIACVLCVCVNQPTKCRTLHISYGIDTLLCVCWPLHPNLLGPFSYIINCLGSLGRNSYPRHFPSMCDVFMCVCVRWAPTNTLCGEPMNYTTITMCGYEHITHNRIYCSGFQMKLYSKTDWIRILGALTVWLRCTVSKFECFVFCVCVIYCGFMEIDTLWMRNIHEFLTMSCVMPVYKVF